MGITAVVTVGVTLGAGVLVARAYGATWKQSSSYILGELLVIMPSSYFIHPYAKNSHQLAALTLTTRVVSCLSGILATGLLSEKTIKWRQAIACQTIYFMIGDYLSEFVSKPEILHPHKV